MKSVDNAQAAIRRADEKDISRIAEIIVFNMRINYLPIFKSIEHAFKTTQVLSVAEEYKSKLKNTLVYDDGVVKGFVCVEGKEIKKLYVDSFFQSEGVGAALIEFAVKEYGADFLWALEKNERAIAFYKRHGFRLTDERIFEQGTPEYLVKMER